MKKMAKTALTTVISLAAAGAFALSAGAAEELKIGMVNPLSGDNALYGLSQENGVRLAIDEINAAGGVNGAQIVLETYDDQGDPQTAASGAQKFADDDSILMITGSSLTSNTLAMVPIFDDAEIVDMVCSSSSPSLTGCSEYFFRMAVQDAQVGPQMCKAILDKEYTQISMLYPNNDFGKSLSASIEEYAGENGGTIVSAYEYNPADQDFTAILTNLKADAPEAVALCGTVTDTSLIIKQMAQLGIEAYKIGHTSLYNSSTFEIAGDAMEGVGCVSVYISSNPDEKVQEFVARYQEKYDAIPDSFAALAYDMTYTFAAAAESAMEANDGEVDRESLKDALVDVEYEGITGTVNFNDNHDWVRDYLTLIVKDGEFTLDD